MTWLRFVFLVVLLSTGSNSWLTAVDEHAEQPIIELAETAAHEVVGDAADPHSDEHDTEDDDEHAAHGHHAGPATWSVIPFALLLLAIAVCPLVVPHFWHHHFPKVAISLGLVTGAYYIFGLHDYISLVHVGFEYFSFIALLSSLFVAAGGIVIKVDKKATLPVNLGILALGAVIANLIGTTGAAMLLIRPFMRVNKGRLKPFHVVFFIFIVANIGGALTPIGDPPLFLGFLKGIDFFQFFELNVRQWVFALIILMVIFAVIDRRIPCPDPVDPPTGKISIQGLGNFAWLGVVIVAVFIDPNKIAALPAVTITDHTTLGFGTGADKSSHVEVFSFIREIIQLGVAFGAYKFANRTNLEANGFNFEPIKEVGYLFIGIFLTMVPALALIKEAAKEGALFGFDLTTSVFYYGTGGLSGVLDNAPTFLSFLAGLEGKSGLSASQISQSIAQGELVADSAMNLGDLTIGLAACAVASVFWGAMTYIGNGPNFMVKAIADAATDEDGNKVVECPSFFGYIIKYSLPILLPVLILTWVVFFSGYVL